MKGRGLFGETLELGVPVGQLSIQCLGAGRQYKSGTQRAFSPDIQLWEPSTNRRVPKASMEGQGWKLGKPGFVGGVF